VVIASVRRTPDIGTSISTTNDDTSTHHARSNSNDPMLVTNDEPDVASARVDGTIYSKRHIVLSLLGRSMVVHSLAACFLMGLTPSLNIISRTKQKCWWLIVLSEMLGCLFVVGSQFGR
jgi:hypothetical protein